MTESVEGGTFITEPAVVARVARMYFELDADILKVAFNGSADSLQEVAAAHPEQVIILGGAKMDSELEVLDVIKGSIDAGGAGVTMGLNVWKALNVTVMVRAISKIIHSRATVEDAMKELQYPRTPSLCFLKTTVFQV